MSRGKRMVPRYPSGPLATAAPVPASARAWHDAAAQEIERLRAELARSKRGCESAWREAERAWALAPEAPARVADLLEAADAWAEACSGDCEITWDKADERLRAAVDTWRACGRPGLSNTERESE